MEITAADIDKPKTGGTTIKPEDIDQPPSGLGMLWDMLKSGAESVAEGLAHTGRADYQKAPPGSTNLQRIGHAALGAVEQGLPTALTAAGGAGPTSTLGRLALASGTGAAAGAAAPGSVQDRLVRAGVGGTVGAGLGGVGETVGHLLAPKLSTDAAALAAKGVRLAPEQMGRGKNTLADRATSLPILGRFIQDTRARSLNTFNHATINQALEPVGATLPSHLTGNAAVKHMGDTISNTYRQIFKAVPKVQPDQPMLGDIAQIEINGRGRPAIWKTLIGEWNHAFQNVRRTGGAVGPRGGTLRVPPMTGEQAQRAMSQLEAKARGLAKSQDSFQREVGQLLHDGRDAIFDAITRQHPQLAPELEKANHAWAMAVRVEDAAGRRAGSNGQFSPMDLLQAVKSDARGVRRREFARGDALFQDWAQTADRVLTSRLGESGTTPRAHLLNPVAWGVGAAGRPLYQGLSAASRSAPGAFQRGAAAVGRRSPAAAAALANEAYAANRRGDVEEVQRLDRRRGRLVPPPDQGR